MVNLSSYLFLSIIIYIIYLSTNHYIYYLSMYLSINVLINLTVLSLTLSISYIYLHIYFLYIFIFIYTSTIYLPISVCKLSICLSIYHSPCIQHITLFKKCNHFLTICPFYFKGKKSFFIPIFPTTENLNLKEELGI